MEQTYHLIDNKLKQYSESLPCCIDKLYDEIVVCKYCKEWTSILDPCCNSDYEPNLCEYCYQKWINYDY